MEYKQEMLGQRMGKVGVEIMYLSSEDVLKILCEKNESNPSLLWFFVISSVLIDLPCDQHLDTKHAVIWGMVHLNVSHRGEKVMQLIHDH